MYARIVVFGIMALLALTAVNAATVTGGIYDHNLNTIGRVVISVNSTPPQTMVSQFGGYQFKLEPNTYRITVEFTKNNITKVIAHDDIEISRDGEYHRDIFIYPDIDFENDFNVTENNTGMPIVSSFFWVVIGLIGAGVAVFVGLFFSRKKGMVSQVLDVEPDDVAKDKIITVLKERKGQASQKYLRAQLPFSESKISLLISQLEQESVVEKIRKGRLNMIVLKR